LNIITEGQTGLKKNYCGQKNTPQAAGHFLSFCDRGTFIYPASFSGEDGGR
jgi:hypothetical protein